MVDTEFKKLVCPNCGNDSHSKKGINYRYLMWISHEVRGKVDDAIIIEGNDADQEFLEKGVKATVTNTPDEQPNCTHFHCGACQWNWLENAAEKKFSE